MMKQICSNHVIPQNVGRLQERKPSSSTLNFEMQQILKMVPFKFFDPRNTSNIFQMIK